MENTEINNSYEAMEHMVDSSQKLMRKYKGTETFRGNNNLIYEKDEYWVLPVSASTYPNPELYALGTQFGEPRLKGQIFKGKNRKERRAAMKKSKN